MQVCVRARVRICKCACVHVCAYANVRACAAQERRRKAINAVRRQWEATMAASRRRVRGSSVTVELHARHLANFANVDGTRDSSPDRRASSTQHNHNLQLLLSLRPPQYSVDIWRGVRGI